MSDFFISSQSFMNVFNLEKYQDYEHCVPFQKGVGFSVQRPYPKTSKFSPPVRKDGTPDTYALIRIKYDVERQMNNRVPISAGVLIYSRYIAEHWDYNFSDDECPTEESILASKRTPLPIDLSFESDYFYDHSLDTFIDEKERKLEGIDILNFIYESHIATVDKIKGLILRWKMSSANKSAAFCGLMKDLFKWLLKAICGRTIAPADASRGIWNVYRQEDLKLLQTESINVFGYSASKNIIITLCVLLLGGYLIFCNTAWSPTWLKNIIKNNLLSFAFVVLAIYVLDHILPRIFFYLVNLMIRLELRLMLMRFKF